MIASIVTALQNIWIWLLNSWRSLLRRRVDYVYLELSGTLPEFVVAPPWWQRRFLGGTVPLSLMGLRRSLQRIANDPHVRGVVLLIRDFEPGWATAESAREELHAFRARGKRVLAYLPGADTRSFFVACVADEVLMTPTAYLNLLGVRVEAQFLGDALRSVGIEAEVTAVSPYKSAGDQFARSDMSPENREQLERLLDQRYTTLVAAIARDRRLPPEQVRALIDRAPFIGRAACAAGLVDGACYEDEIETRLNNAERLRAEPGQAAGAQDAAAPAADARTKLTILKWGAATKALRIPYRKRQRRYVGVVSISGAITQGKSRNVPLPLPLLGGAQAGSDSIVQALRRVERSKQISALVLHVDSPGGDAFASDLIWREVLRIRHQKPVVVSMGNVAASGGYYVAACANAIVAHPATLTGSIGVLSLRPVANDLLERLGINTVVLSRGARTGLLSATQPPSDDERAATRDTVFEIYADFKQRVCEGRNLTEEQLEPLAGGRVWTGQEAQTIGLVDELGGLNSAIARARELARLPADPLAPILYVGGGGRGGALLPRPFPNGALTELPLLMQELLRPRLLAALPWVLTE